MAETTSGLLTLNISNPGDPHANITVTAIQRKLVAGEQYRTTKLYCAMKPELSGTA